MRVHAAYADELRTVDLDAGSDGEGTTGTTALDGVESVAADGERVLVGTQAGVHRSADGGEAFARAADVDDPVTALAVGPDGTAWLGTEPSTVYRSTDGGETWTERGGLTDLPSADRWSFPPQPDTHRVRWIEVDPTDPSRLYVAIEAGALVRTEDGGGTWLDRTPDGPRDTHEMATHPDAPGRGWVAAGDGFFETTDGGDSWATAEAGLSGTYCWSVAVDPGDPTRLLVSSAGGPRSAHSQPAESYVYRRAERAEREEGEERKEREEREEGEDGEGREGGEGTWERIETPGLPTGRGVTRPVLAAAGRGSTVAASNEGVFLTRDWGASWARIADAPADATTCRGLAVA